MQVLFTTDRLLGRWLEPEDLAAMAAVYGDADAMRWVDDGQPLDESGCARWIDVTRENYRTRGYGMTAIVERTSGTVVGFCGLVHPGGQPEAEIKYAFKRECWGAGFATEAARAMLEYGAAAHDIDCVIATTAPENLASHRVLEKCGMQRGELRRNDDGSATQIFRWQRPRSVVPVVSP